MTILHPGPLSLTDAKKDLFRRLEMMVERSEDSPDDWRERLAMVEKGTKVSGTTYGVEGSIRFPRALYELVPPSAFQSATHKVFEGAPQHTTIGGSDEYVALRVSLNRY